MEANFFGENLLITIYLQCINFILLSLVYNTYLL